MPNNPRFSNSVSSRSVLARRGSRHSDTRGMDHVRLHPPCAKPARQPKAVAASFEGKYNPHDIGTGGVQYGISVAQIYRAANNPLIDRMIARFHSDSGEFIPKGAIGARRAISALRRGTHLALLADQKMNDGIPVPFFGRPAMTAPRLRSFIQTRRIAF